MDKLLEKISRYHLINYIIPGVLTIYLSKQINQIELLTSNMFFDIVMAYALGLICSRIGSLIVEPLLKLIHFVHFADYKDYMSAEKNDPKLTDLNTDNNLYRTIAGSALFIAVQMGFVILKTRYDFVREYSSIIILIAFLLLFLFSYKKQTSYIVKRVDKYKNS